MRARPSYYHIGSVRKNLTRAVQAALAATPSSLRALAREARVPHVTLVQIRQGAVAASPALAAKVAQALAAWGTRCTTAARKVRVAARRVPNPRTRRKS